MFVTLAAPAVCRLATLDQARARIPAAAGLDDARLGALIDDKSAAISSYCRRALGRAQYRLTACGPVSRVPALAPWPVVSIDAVAISGAAAAAESVEIAALDLYWLVDGARSIWPAGLISVDLTGGWRLPDEPTDSAPALPHVVTAACIDLVARVISADGRDPALRRESIVGVAQFDYAAPTDQMLKGCLPIDVAASLDPFVFRVSV